MDPFTATLLFLFGIIALIMIVVGMSPDMGPMGSFGGLLLAGVLMCSANLYRDAHYTENGVLVQNGIACYVGSPTNSCTTFVLIDKDGRQINPEK